jgi:cytochrome c5
MKIQYMKKLLVPVTVMVAIIAGLTGCYYDKAEILYPAGSSTCDTTAASTFNGSVLPILNNNCKSCHGAPAVAGAGIILDSYAGVKAQVDNGKLMGDLNQTAGFNAMPLGGSKLSACDLAIVQRWINAGAQNN